MHRQNPKIRKIPEMHRIHRDKHRRAFAERKSSAGARFVLSVHDLFTFSGICCVIIILSTVGRLTDAAAFRRLNPAGNPRGIKEERK